MENNKKSTQSLDGNWSLKLSKEEEILPVKIPGSVYSALLDIGRLEDPYWRDNEKNMLPIMEQDFLFSKRFTVNQEIQKHKRKILRLEGIDTIANVWMNEYYLGKVENMHRIYEFEVTKWLRVGENDIKIEIFSPTKYMKEKQEQCYVDGSSDAMVGFPHIRKAHCMFGWDWGPRIPDAGIWRSVNLLGVTSGLLESVHVLQEHFDDKVLIHFDMETKYTTNFENITYKASMITPDGEVLDTENIEEGIIIKRPQLWWPNGYGKQSLYTVMVEMNVNGSIIDCWERKIGIRTLTMHIEKDEWGESFATEVNGIQVFAMGADYIPEDNIFSARNEVRTRRLLEDCIAANFNTVRIWGGGYYPDHYFFDLCDELGIMVWHDFMFACAIYELTEEFEENIKAELVDNIKRLRHHPSIALWCGNNEMEWQVDDKIWNYTPKQKSDYIKMYEYLFPQIVKKHDIQRFYWKASPSSGGGFDSPNDYNRGDVHYWDVWHGCKPFSDYRNYYFRYASEFGFQSFPSLKTIKTFTEPKDRNIFSYVMEKHQRNNSANGKILQYMADMFLYPSEFDTLLYASQILQAEAVKYGVEHWRRNRGRCMGAIYWQLNDCWPVTSWASIDYCNRWKALHYYARRFFAPIMISCCEEGTITQNTNVNAEDTEIEKSTRLSIANETRDSFKGVIRWSLRNTLGESVKEGDFIAEVEALTSKWFDKLDFSEIDEYKYYFSYDLLQDNEIISGGTVIFCQPKHFEFVNPNLKTSVEGDVITITADAYAKGVELDCPDSDMILSDNYFDMNGGIKQVKILRGTVGNICLKSVFDIR